MKRIVLMSFIISALGLVSHFALADIKATVADTKNTSIDSKLQTESWLGVWIEDIPAALGSHLLPILKKDQGVLIKKIAPDSPAHQAGLQNYDVIANFNDQMVFSQQQLTQLIQSTQPESRVELGIIRHGKLLNQEVIFKAFPGRNTVPVRANHPPVNSFHHFGGLRQLHPPTMNEPFLNSHFSRDFNRKFNQELYQLREKMHHLEQQMKQRAQQTSWSQFESIQIESMGKNKHRAKVAYEDSEGNKKEFVFEGNLNEMRQQIMAQENMAEDKKQSLLQALNMNQGYAMPFRQNSPVPPGWFNQPLPAPNRFRNNP